MSCIFRKYCSANVFLKFEFFKTICKHFNVFDLNNFNLKKIIYKFWIFLPSETIRQVSNSKCISIFTNHIIKLTSLWSSQIKSDILIHNLIANPTKFKQQWQQFRDNSRVRHPSAGGRRVEGYGIYFLAAHIFYYTRAFTIIVPVYFKFMFFQLPPRHTPSWLTPSDFLPPPHMCKEQKISNHHYYFLS
jgi:hypothetical protein